MSTESGSESVAVESVSLIASGSDAGPAQTATTSTNPESAPKQRRGEPYFRPLTAEEKKRLDDNRREWEEEQERRAIEAAERFKDKPYRLPRFRSQLGRSLCPPTDKPRHPLFVMFVEMPIHVWEGMCIFVLAMMFLLAVIYMLVLLGIVALFFLGVIVLHFTGVSTVEFKSSRLEGF